MSRALLCFVPLALAAACGDDASEVAATGGTAGSSGSGGSAGGGGSGGDASVDAPACTGAPTLHTFVALGPNEPVLNPGRGFHDFVDLGSKDDFQGVRAAGRTLAYAGVSLLDYVDAPIPSAFLSQLSAGLDRVRAAKIKVILRFVYRNDIADPNDAKLTRILEHIQTLAPLLKQHADVIAMLEAGFIGPWGEWHSSSNGLDTDAAAKKAILDALLAATPPDMFVLVRRWSFKHDHAGGPVTAAQAFDGTPVSRLGHHNDCFLASDDDMGTYPSGQAAHARGRARRSRRCGASRTGAARSRGSPSPGRSPTRAPGDSRAGSRSRRSSPRSGSGRGRRGGRPRSGRTSGAGSSRARRPCRSCARGSPRRSRHRWARSSSS